MKDKLERIKEIKRAIEDHNFEVGRLKGEFARLQQEIKDHWADEGTSAHKGTDGTTIFLKRSLHTTCNKALRHEALQWLKDSEIDKYVKDDFDIKSIGAYVREMDKAGEELPKGFEEKFHIEEIFTLGFRNL